MKLRPSGWVKRSANALVRAMLTAITALACSNSTPTAVSEPKNDPCATLSISITSPKANAAFAMGPVLVEGTAQMAVRVEVASDDEPFATAISTSGTFATWSSDLQFPTAGAHTIRARAVNTGGATCAAQVPINVKPIGGGSNDAGENTGDGGTDAGTGNSKVLPDKFWGVTTDSISGVSDIVESLRRLPTKPVTRVVFDEVPASQYVDAMKQISQVSFTMGELLDSFYMKNWTLPAFQTRTQEYFTALDANVDIWEIGNEVNGSWNGDAPSVVAKIGYAFDYAVSHGKKTALTLYYNEGCASGNELMFNWVQAYLPPRMRNADYVFLSYYEDDCEDLQPDWQAVFTKLGSEFPTSKLGIGECGTKFANRKDAYVRRYYVTKVTQPNYVGGYFWWYFHQDMVPYTTPLWNTLAEVVAPP